MKEIPVVARYMSGGNKSRRAARTVWAGAAANAIASV
jgi:hypothetical protein